MSVANVSDPGLTTSGPHPLGGGNSTGQEGAQGAYLRAMLNGSNLWGFSAGVAALRRPDAHHRAHHRCAWRGEDS